MTHTHDHGAGLTNRRRLLVAIGIVASVLVLEVFGAWISGSLALLADAGHMLSDLTGLVVALVATILAARPATDRATYGHRRTEVFAAFINGSILVAVVVFVTVEAISRLTAPSDQSVAGTPMLVIAAIGAAANFAALLVLRGGAASSINMRGAYLEVLGDLIGSVVVIVAAIVLLTTGFSAADGLASLVIAALILPRAVLLLREVANVLGEATPRGTDVALIRNHVLGTTGVVGVHDVHVWAITPGVNVFSAHVVVATPVFTRGGTGALLDELESCLAEHFDVEHSTFQLEPAEHAAHEEHPHR